MKKLQSLFAAAAQNKNVAKVGTGLALAGSSVSSFAVDYTAEIDAAKTDGIANITAVILAVVAVAIVGFSVGRMLGWFNK